MPNLASAWRAQEAGGNFAEALAALPEAELLHAGGDAAGSHALEAFLTGPAAGAKLKKRLLRQLRGGYGRLAATPGGSHVVQAAYRTGVRFFLPDLAPMHGQMIFLGLPFSAQWKACPFTQPGCCSSHASRLCKEGLVAGSLLDIFAKCGYQTQQGMCSGRVLLSCAEQGLKDKEAIASELAAAEAHIAASSFGQILLKRCAAARPPPKCSHFPPLGIDRCCPHRVPCLSSVAL